MTGNFEYFVFSVFKTDSLLLQDIKKRIADLYQESFASGKAVFISDAFSITRYYNPSVSGSKDDIFTFLKNIDYKDFTFFVSNSADGRYTLCNWLSKKISCDYLMCTMTSNDAKYVYQMNSFNYVKQGDLNTERCVLAYKDPKWTFFEKGEPASFENPRYYQNKYIKDRLNLDILKEYLLNYGIDFEKIGLNIQEYFTIRKTL